MRVEHCKSCHAPIVWAGTASGKLMPVDVDSSPAGNLRLEYTDAGELVAEVVPAGSQDALRTSHFATCPNAAKHRRKVRHG